MLILDGLKKIFIRALGNESTTQSLIDDWNDEIESVDRVVDALIESARRTCYDIKRSYWEWYEEWSPSTPSSPEECEECGWRCNKCKMPLSEVIKGYWDDIDDPPKIKYCPECGAKMDLEDR